MTAKFQQSLAVVKQRLEANLEEGLLVAANVLQAEAQKLCPVDTGALRASAFTRRDSTPTSNRIQYTVGFTQFYGIYVHEMQGPFKVGQPKFLEEPARQLIKEMGGLIQSKFNK